MNEITLLPTKLNSIFRIRELFHIHSYYYTPQFVFNGECHAPWEFVFVQSGRVVVETADSRYILKEGTAILHKPHEFHKIKADNTSCYLFIITFSTDNDPLLMPVADRPLHADETAKNYILNIIADGTSLVADKMQFSDQNKANPVPFAAEQTVKNLLELLFLRLLRQNTADPDPQSSAQPSTDNALVLSVLKIIEKNICEKISLDFIAKQVGYSVSRISSVFKTYTGMSVIDYYIRQRIRKAQELIFENKHSFQEISDAMNFDSVQYFSWQFKKITGMSPSQYRNITKSGASLYDVRLGKL